MVEAAERAAVLGRPSYVWQSGQERRLALIRRYVDLENARILDVGCGIGTYVNRLRGLSEHVYGIRYRRAAHTARFCYPPQPGARRERAYRPSPTAASTLSCFMR